MIERERTYLAKSIPKGLKSCRHKEIFDVYFPKESVHPIIRLRKSGDRYELTKKIRVDKNDASCQAEHTIPLSENEFLALSRLEGKRLRKIRYYYDYKGRIAEVDVFLDELKGLVMVDVEFEEDTEKDAFEMPDFCLADVTQDEFAAGGMLCGKSYGDIESELKKRGYKKLVME